MNYFAHALPVLAAGKCPEFGGGAQRGADTAHQSPDPAPPDDRWAMPTLQPNISQDTIPYFIVGTAVPDWLSVVDRRLRLRPRHVETFLGDAEPRVSALAAGVTQHFRDDAHFHRTRVFAETSLALTVAAREALGGDASFRPSFLGHLLVEMLLDAALAARYPEQVAAYYRTLEAADAAAAQELLNRMAARPTDRLAPMMRAFCQARIIDDYLDDGRLMMRLNQVMHRLSLAPLPQAFAAVLPAARQMIDRHRFELLQDIPAS